MPSPSDSARLADVRDQGVSCPEAFCASLPPLYFELADAADLRQHELLLQRLRESKDRTRIFRLRGDTEQFVAHAFDVPAMVAEILAATKTLEAGFLYRTFVNRKEDFLLHAIYANVMLGPRAAEFSPLDFRRWRGDFLDERGHVRRHLVCDHDPAAQRIEVRCVNVAHRTLLSNLWETIERHQLAVDVVEGWRQRHLSPAIASFSVVGIHTTSRISDDELASLRADFERYIQHFTVPMSIFDIVGPSMVGPSSSHTAGANLIGQIARSIILAKAEQGETIETIEVKLRGSFRDTGVGHKTPSAIGGGLCGLAADDEGMIARGDPGTLAAEGIRFGAHVARFLGFSRGLPEEDQRYAGDRNANIAEILFSTDRAAHAITGFSIGGGNVEVRYFDGPLDQPITGKCDLFLDGDRIVPRQNPGGTLPVVRRIFSASPPRTGYVMPFNTVEELADHCRQTGLRLIDVVVDVESRLQGTTREAIYAEMRRAWAAMQRAVAQGLASQELSPLRLSGDAARKIHRFLGGHPLFDNIYGRAAAYATAVNEQNAKSGVIVACPTAGSCGIVPGVLQAYAELAEPAENLILESLMVSGFLGMLLFTDVSTAGADYGCQAEIGAAAAMAAAALCSIEGGDVEAVTAAFTLALKNSMGLICDPVAGLVEVPCVKRNGVYASLAISAALLALSGVRSYVSPDEVILTVREVGERICSDYKETARGGLARTRDGKHVEKLFEGELKRFFAREM